MKLTLLLSILLASFCNSFAEQLKCDICGQPIHGKYYYYNDAGVGGRKNLCLECSKIEDRCFICNLPVKEASVSLADGRFLCARDNKVAIASEDQAKQVCEETKNDLDRMLARFLSYPGTNVMLSIVNRFYLENLFKQPGEGQACVSVYGATTSNHLPNGKIVHSVCILSHLPNARLRAVCAHEFTHAWMGENVSQKRRSTLDKDTVEGFCELVAYKYMVSLEQTNEMNQIRKNDYTKGKIDVLIAADEKYGFGAVMDWIKTGEDGKLEADRLDRIRALDGGDYTPVAQNNGLIYAPAALKQVAAPDKLVLKSISGSSAKRFALINNTTFEAMEKARVKLGQTNVTVRCLEIGDDYVTVQVDGATEKTRLALNTR